MASSTIVFESSSRSNRTTGSARSFPRVLNARATCEVARLCDVVALAPRHAELVERPVFVGRLDTFGDEGRADLVAERDERGTQRALDGVSVDIARERDVELDDVGTQREDVAEACE